MVTSVAACSLIITTTSQGDVISQGKSHTSSYSGSQIFPAIKTEYVVVAHEESFTMRMRV